MKLIFTYLSILILCFAFIILTAIYKADIVVAISGNEIYSFIFTMIFYALIIGAAIIFGYTIRPLLKAISKFNDEIAYSYNLLYIEVRFKKAHTEYVKEKIDLILENIEKELPSDISVHAEIQLIEEENEN
jgi:hypothetical protein